MEDVIDEYQSSLEDLTFNSKPHINMLTILAEENKQHAEHVARLIEAQIAKAREKLPLLYLLDSIVKNVGENYKPLFAKNLANVFKLSFEAADDKNKMSLYKLRTTWDDYFPLKKLHALDVLIQGLDPNWPVKPLPSHLQDSSGPTIHVNPKFLKKNDTRSTTAPKSAASKTNVKPSSTSTTTTAQASDVDNIQQQLIRQQKELLDLQQKKLLLELEQTKQQLAAKQREAVQTVTQKQGSQSKDARNLTPGLPPGGLKVTVSNTKALPKQLPKDPRVKPIKKTSEGSIKSKTRTSPLQSFTSGSPDGKKKMLKASDKKEKAPDAVKTKTLNASALPNEKRDQGHVAPEVEHKKRVNQSKTSRSQSPPSKVPRRTASPAESPRKSAQKERLSDPRKPIKNQKIHSLKEKKDSSRSSESSQSPRFSPEPDSDVSPARPVHMFSPQRIPFGKRNDALHRRPSFDPDLHIPQQLTIGHQHEILRQADVQLRSGQLTHEQHQELLKQLHQLFEVQRRQKMQDHPSRDPRQIPPHVHPMDPREARRMPKKRFVPPPLEHRRSDHIKDRGTRKPDYRDPPMSHGRPPPLAGPRRRSPTFEKESPGPMSLKRRQMPPSKRHFPPKQPPDSVPKAASRDLRRPPSPNAMHTSEEMHRPLPRPPMRDARRDSPPQEPPDLSPPDFLRSSNAPVLGVPEPQRLSPPPLPPSFEGQAFSVEKTNIMSNEKDSILHREGKHKNLRRFARGDAPRRSTADEQRKQEQRKRPAIAPHPKKRPVPSMPASDVHPSDEKTGLEEPEDYIIANMPPEIPEPENKLEEPEDYIIAGMETDEKQSCEEPEDFIIAQMPPEAEAYHKHSMGLKRNSESEKAYQDHKKKIKQSIYEKELREANRRSSVSDAAPPVGEESSSEKSSGETEQASKKEETIRSPSLPLKKRRYISSPDTEAVEKAQTVSSQRIISEETETAVKPEVEKAKELKSVTQTTKDPSKTSKPEAGETSEPTPTVKPDADGKVESEGTTEVTAKAEDVKPVEKLQGAPSQVDTEKETAKVNQSKSEETKPSKLLSQTDAAKTSKLEASAVRTDADRKARSERASKTKKNGVKQSRTSKKREDKRRQKVEPKKDDYQSINEDKDSLIYIIDDEPTEPEQRRGPREPRSMRGRGRGPKEWHHDKSTYDEEEEARIQKMLEDEKRTLEWEERLHRELELEHLAEERMRRARRGRGRGRGGHFMHPDRMESPPRDIREPGMADIARGRIPGGLRGRIARPRPMRPDDRPFRRPPPFPHPDDMRMPHPMDDFPRSPSPGRMAPPPHWEVRRRSPPGYRLHPHPDFIDRRDPRDEMLDHHMNRLPPRDILPPMHPDEKRPPPEFFMKQEPLPAPSINQVDVNELLASLISKGIIPGTKKPDETDAANSTSAETTDQQKPVANLIVPVKTEAAPSPPLPAMEEDIETPGSVSPFIEEDLMVLDPDAKIPEIILSSDLKIRHDEIIKRLYTGIQCAACGLRFTTRQTDLYADHLDWHYRTNRKDKEGGAVTHREIYPTAGDWIFYEAVANPDDRSRSTFFDEMEGEPIPSSKEDVLTVPVTGQAGEDACKVCKEAFETFYNEADDEWQFANCVKVFNDNFHPNCYNDHDGSLSTPTNTHSPEEPTLHETEDTDASAVKGEVETTVPASPPFLLESEDESKALVKGDDEASTSVPPSSSTSQMSEISALTTKKKDQSAVPPPSSTSQMSEEISAPTTKKKDPSAVPPPSSTSQMSEEISAPTTKKKDQSAVPPPSSTSQMSEEISAPTINQEDRSVILSLSSSALMSEEGSAPMVKDEEQSSTSASLSVLQASGDGNTLTIKDADQSVILASSCSSQASEEISVPTIKQEDQSVIPSPSSSAQIPEDGNVPIIKDEKQSSISASSCVLQASGDSNTPTIKDADQSVILASSSSSQASGEGSAPLVEDDDQSAITAPSSCSEDCNTLAFKDNDQSIIPAISQASEYLNVPTDS